MSILRIGAGLARKGAGLVGPSCFDECCGQPGDAQCGKTCSPSCSTSALVDFGQCEWGDAIADYFASAQMALVVVDVDDPPCCWLPATQYREWGYVAPFGSDVFQTTGPFAPGCCTIPPVGNCQQLSGWALRVECTGDLLTSRPEVAAIQQTMPGPWFLVSYFVDYEVFGDPTFQGVTYTLFAVASVPQNGCLQGAVFTTVPVAYPTFYDLGAPAEDLSVVGTVTIT
jgi:hypothetical protein